MHIGYKHSLFLKKSRILKKYFSWQYNILVNTPDVKGDYSCSKCSIEDIMSSKFCIIDLSFERPSCYYELGLIDALGVRKFLVSASDTIIHQYDGVSNILYFSSLDEYEDLMRSISKGESLIRFHKK